MTRGVTRLDGQSSAASALELLRLDHEAAVLHFEQANRAFFARSVSDRGDAYFEHFRASHETLVAEQAEGVGAFYLLVDANALVLGRFNLFFEPPDTARVGYRIAESVAGQGVATVAVRNLCDIAATEHRVRTLRAATAYNNGASRRVLIKAGFVLAGPADPEDIGGKPGNWYQRSLTAEIEPRR